MGNTFRIANLLLETVQRPAVFEIQGRHKRKHLNICDENAEKWSFKLCCGSPRTAPCKQTVAPML